MQYLQRDRSVLTGKRNLEHLTTLNHFPVFIGATNSQQSEDHFADLSLAICPETGIIQLDKVLPLDLIYSGYHSEALGSVWEHHHKEFVAFIQKYPISHILEIGGSDGRLAKEYVKKDPHISWTIVEPNPVAYNHTQITFINALFDASFEYSKPLDALIHSHTLEHMYEPKIFLQKASELLENGQYHIFSVPNLYAYLEEKFTNILNFEHTIFLTEYCIDYLLAEFGFDTIEKKYIQKHSIFYATKKTDKKVPFSFHSKYSEYKKKYLSYLACNAHIIHNLNIQMKSWSGNIYLFGAHVFTQYLANQGLDTNKIKGIIDNSKLKQQKRLYGTDLTIYPPDILAGQEHVAIILKAGAYQQEVKKQLLGINETITIWE